MMQKDIKICILSEYAYPLLTGKGTRFGGAELQMTILAIELVNRGYDVSFITFEKSNNKPEIINGIKVYNPYNMKGRGSVHFYPPNMYKLFKILNKIDGDIYIQRAGTPLTGIISIYSLLTDSVFIFSASTDGNVSTALKIESIKDIVKYVYKFGVQHSDCVLCQSDYQKELLWQTIKKDGKVIKNIYIPPKEKNILNDNRKYVLWVKRIGKEKRPELFIKLSKVNPDIKFVMIGGLNAKDNEYYNKIKKNAETIDNLDFYGFVPHDEISKYFAEAMLLVNTSELEGFPNTFLEAWGNYTPVITLNFDPDNIISKYKLGICSKNFKDLKKDFHTLLVDFDLIKKMGENGRNYVEKEHNIDKIVNEYEKLFEILLNRNRYDNVK